MNNVKYATVLYTTRMAQEKYKVVVYHKTMSNVIVFLEKNSDSDPTKIFLLDLIKILRFTIPTNRKKITFNILSLKSYSHRVMHG